MKPIVSLTVLALVGACAEYAVEVPEAYVSKAQYRPLGCTQLRNERTQVIQAVSALSAQQDKRASNDILAVGAGMVVWPAFLLVGEGTDPTTALALAKGHHTAIDSTMVEKGCTF